MKQFIPAWLKDMLIGWTKQYAIKSYSHEGEDMILRRIFENDTPSFYVDVGAHHPKRFSNTFYFYKKGWSGINIDAMPGSMKAFNKVRPRDINIELAVSDEKAEMTYFIYNEPALNTFDEKLVPKRNKDGYRLIKTKKITTRTLREILGEHLPADKKIKFMSIDVEGLDLSVIRSNDWKKYRPDYVLIESDKKTMNEIQASGIYQLMVQQEYELFAKTVLTLIFRNKLL